MSQHHLFLGHLRDSLLDRVPRYEAVNHDLVLLADTMRSRESLDVVVRIPIGVVDNDSVSGCKIDSQATGTSGQKEDELRGTGRVETIDGLLTQISGDAAINTLVLVARTVQEVF